MTRANVVQLKINIVTDLKERHEENRANRGNAMCLIMTEQVVYMLLWIFV